MIIFENTRTEFAKLLEKDAKGSLTRLLILLIVNDNQIHGEDSWGYSIKKKLKSLTQTDEIKDSSLYTILKRFETLKILKPEKKEIRTVYSLTNLGKESLEEGIAFWRNLIKFSKEKIDKFDMKGGLTE